LFKGAATGWKNTNNITRRSGLNAKLPCVSTAANTPLFLRDDGLLFGYAETPDGLRAAIDGMSP
jgi:hypothetical protein